MMKYSKSETIKLATEINKELCLKDLDSLIFKEGCDEVSPYFKENEIVLDMDCVEGKTASKEKRSPNKSMDAAFVMLDSVDNYCEILMVEFRFNYMNMKNLNKNDLFGKVTGSKEALFTSKLTIADKFIFIFNTNLKEQAKRRFRNMVPSMPAHFIATDIQDLKSTYF